MYISISEDAENIRSSVSSLFLLFVLGGHFEAVFSSSPRLSGRSSSFFVVPGVLFAIIIGAAAEHFVVVGVVLFVSGESAEVFFSGYPGIIYFYKLT